MSADSTASAPGRRWSWREWSAVAAALVLGILLGPPFLSASQPLPLIQESGRVVAVGALETVLDGQATGVVGKDPLGTVIGMSFRAASGGWCRSFATQRGPAGLACRERGDWVIEVLARNPRPRDGSAPDGYRQSGVPFPEAIRQVVAARQQGEALTPAAEAQAIAARWRN